MAYYFVIEGGIHYGNKEVIFETFDRPISFKEKLQIGKREHGLVGKKEVEVEVFSHDKVKVTALRDTNLALTIHEENPNETDTINQRSRAIEKDGEVPKDDGNPSVVLKKGHVLELYKTSFNVDGRTNEQIVWSPGLNGIPDF